MPEFIDNMFASLRSKKPAPTKTIGASGTVINSGYIQENENNAKLRGVEKYRTYSDILANVSIVAAGSRYFLNLLAKAEWTVQPASGEGVSEVEAQRMADLVDEILKDMTTPWFRIVRRAAMYRFYGFSVQEWTAKRRDDGVIGFLDIEPRMQATIERWDTDTTGTVFGMIQRVPQTGLEIYIPRAKTVYVVDDTFSDAPDGFGLFRQVAEASMRLQEFQRFESYGYEMDLRGIPIMRAPIAEINAAAETGDISKEDAQKTINDMKAFLANHSRNPKQGMLFDSAVYMTTDEAQRPSNVPQWDITTLQSESAESSKAIGIAIERLNREIARILGVEHLLLGGDGAGSLALSRDKTNNFGLLIDSSLQELKAALSNDVLDTLWQLNGWDPKLMPEFRIEQIQYRDINQITGALKELTEAALSPDDPAINEVRRLLGLSDQPEITPEMMLALMTMEDENTQPPDVDEQAAVEEGEE